MSAGTGGSPVEAASAAAEAVRTLNHATRRGGYVEPCDVAATLAELLLLVERLPQSLSQVRCWVEEEYLAGRVGHDGGEARAPQAVVEIQVELDDATVHLEALAQSLRTAHEAASHLTGITPDDTADGGAQ